MGNLPKFGSDDEHKITVYNYQTKIRESLDQPKFIEFVKNLEAQYGPNNRDIRIEKCAVIRNGSLNSLSYHAMIVMQLANGLYVSFERIMDGAVIQLSVNFLDVIHYIKGYKRIKSLKESHFETAWVKGNGSFLTTLHTILVSGYFGKTYNYYTNNCQQFAKLIYKHASMPGTKPYKMHRLRKAGKGHLPPRPK